MKFPNLSRNRTSVLTAEVTCLNKWEAERIHWRVASPQKYRLIQFLQSWFAKSRPRWHICSSAVAFWH